MQIVARAREIPTGGRPVCVAIGTFDGVHLGHQAVLQQTLADARAAQAMAVAVTFDRHPAAVLAPTRQPRLIYPVPQKLRALATAGVETTWLISFDRAFSQQSGEEFIQLLVREAGPVRSVCVGTGFVFGHRRSGNLGLLQQMGERYGYTTRGLAPVLFAGEPVSSTRIRAAIQAGDFSLASALLGRPYSLAGLVTRGDQLGRQLGFPTANLEVSGLVLPPTGVYSVEARLSQDRRCPALLNLGYRPTIANTTPLLRAEAHLLDFTGNLYDQELEVVFRQKLRDELKFPSLAALQTQIQRDIAAARSLVGAGG